MWNLSLAGVNALYAALVVVPAFVACVRPARQRLLWFALLATAAFWVWLMFQTHGAIPHVVAPNSLAEQSPVRVGPSYLSVLDLAMAAPVVLWMPFVLSYVVYRLLRRHRQLPPVPVRVGVMALLAYMALAVLVTTLEMGLAEYAQEGHDLRGRVFFDSMATSASRNDRA